MRSHFLCVLGVLALLTGCSKAQEAPRQAEAPRPVAARTVARVLLTEDARDTHSFARPAEARVTHIALNLNADFDEKRLSGTATLHLLAARDAKEIVLDTKGLEVSAVRNREGERLPFRFGPADPTLGRPLIIQLNGARRIVIDYRSAPDAAALQWLTPQQTAGRKLPFLFSQGQAILNRSWIPTQDSPGIRQTWEARINVPEGMRAVMSAENLTPDGEPAGPGRRLFRFRMAEPVAPYLIAIAVGDIAFRPLGKRTGVYAEPATLKAAAAEFADTEKMVEAAEALYGPYRWGRYDMIVLPPAFPYGGMENPRLTFLTPTLLAGDKSLVSTVAHELAHSWSGNLVTNANWSDFWLNEGLTTYIQSRIMERLYGTEATNREIALGWDDLQRGIAAGGGMDAPGTRLHLDPVPKDPDDTTADVAYEKGAAFLRTIEAAVGRERFDAWLRSYFDRHAFQPITSALFLEDLREHLIRGDRALERKLMLDQWVYQTGVPANVAPPPAEAFAAVDAAVAAYAGGAAAVEVPFPGWTTAERLRFINGLPRTLPGDRLAELDRAFRLSASGNSEVLFAWAKLAIANRYEPAVPAIERFLTAQGRRKFVEPLFKALIADADWGRPIAERIYARTRPSYHAVTSRSVDALLEAPPAKTAP